MKAGLLNLGGANCRLEQPQFTKPVILPALYAEHGAPVQPTIAASPGADDHHTVPPAIVAEPRPTPKLAPSIKPPPPPNVTLAKPTANNSAPSDPGLGPDVATPMPSGPVELPEKPGGSAPIVTTPDQSGQPDDTVTTPQP